MGEDYRLIRYLDPQGRPFWELAPSSCKETEFQKLMQNPRTMNSVRKLIAQISKIMDYGIQKSCATSKLRCIDASIGLYEIKGFDEANREMAYVICKSPAQIVLLHWFKGHQGSSNISPEIKHAKPLALKAASLLKTID